MTTTITADEFKTAVLDLLAQVPTQALPKWKEDETGCLWFKHLRMGWSSMSHPERASASKIEDLLACESAAREFARRRDTEAVSA